MYNLTPEQIDASLEKKTAQRPIWKDGTVSIVLLENVLESLRAKMVRIGK